MNDNTKVLDKNPSVDPTAMGSQIPVQPTGSMLKEQAPIGSGLSELNPAGPEVKHEISGDLKGLGVEETPDRPDLTQVPEIRHAGPSVPVSSGPSGSVRLPMSEEEVTSQLKTGQNDDSGKWLAGLLQKIIRAMGL